jgi:hypothetical protein
VQLNYAARSDCVLPNALATTDFQNVQIFNPIPSPLAIDSKLLRSF